MLEQALLFIASFVANTMSAFAGGGAGLVQFPVLIFMGLPFSVALATHKTATVALGLGAAYRHLKNPENINWPFALYVMLCGVFGTILGAFLIIRVPDKPAELTLGLLTIALGVYSIYKKKMGYMETHKHRDTPGYTIGGLVLFLIGILNGSLTSGSGLFVTVWLIQWFGLDYKRAVMYTMLLVGLFWNATGAISLSLFGGQIYWLWMPVLLIASLLGGYAGAHMGLLKGSTWIKRGFEIVTIASGLYLVIRFFT